MLSSSSDMTALVAIGLISARYVKGEQSYLVADRRAVRERGRLGATLPATQLSAGNSSIGTVGYIAFYGYFYDWFWVALWAGWMISLLFVAPKMYEFGRTHNGMTIPDILGARFGTALRLIGAVALIGAFLLLFSAEYEGAATVFNLVFGIGYVPAVLSHRRRHRGVRAARRALLDRAQRLAADGGVRGRLRRGGRVRDGESRGFLGSPAQADRDQPRPGRAPFGNHLMSAGTLVGLSIGTTVTFIAYPLDAMKFYAAARRSALLRAICDRRRAAGGHRGIAGLHRRVRPGSHRPHDNADDGQRGAIRCAARHAAGTGRTAHGGRPRRRHGGIKFHRDDRGSRVQPGHLAHGDAAPAVRTGAAATGTRRVRGRRRHRGPAGGPSPRSGLGTVIVVIVQQFMASTFAVTLIAALNWQWRATALGAAVSMCAGFARASSCAFALGDPFGLAPVYLGLPLSLLGMVVTSLGSRRAPGAHGPATTKAAPIPPAPGAGAGGAGIMRRPIQRAPPSAHPPHTRGSQERSRPLRPGQPHRSQPTPAGCCTAPVPAGRYEARGRSAAGPRSRHLAARPSRKAA